MTDKDLKKIMGDENFSNFEIQIDCSGPCRFFPGKKVL